MARPTRLLPEDDALAAIQVDLLPFHIKHNGPAPIATYFLRRPCPPEVAQGPDELISSFRGRELHGTPVSLPSGYQGRVLRTSAPTLAPSRPTRQPVIRKRLATEATGALVGRRTSPRKAKKAKMTHNLDSPTSSPVRSSTRNSPVKMAATAAFEAVMTEEEAEDVAMAAARSIGAALAEEEDDSMLLEEAPIETDVKATIDLTPLHRFDRFTLWCPDGTPVDRHDDIYARSLDEWIGLSHLCNGVEPRTAPQLTSISIALQLNAVPDSLLRSFRVVFGKTDAVTSVVYEQRTAEVEYIVLVAASPPLATVEHHAGKVELFVQGADADSKVIVSCSAGDFVYMQPPLQHQLYPPPPTSYVEAPTYDLAHFEHKPVASTSNTFWQANASGSPAFAPAPIPAYPAPNVQSPFGQQADFTSAPLQPRRRPPPSLADFDTPTIIRASRLTAEQQARACPIQLVFDSDWSAMTKNWNPDDEFAALRRLVRVHRTLQGHFCHVGCEAVPVNVYNRMAAVDQDGLVLVSCLYREDHDGCYVTESDVLYLLEAIIGQTLGAEDESKLRTDTNAFAPEVISNGRPELAAYLQQLSGYTAPTVVDDGTLVKVFPWRSLPVLLQRIMLKFTLIDTSGEPISSALRQSRQTFSPNVLTPLLSPRLPPAGPSPTLHPPPLQRQTTDNSSASSFSTALFSPVTPLASFHAYPPPPVYQHQQPHYPQQIASQQLSHRLPPAPTPPPMAPGALVTRLRMMQGAEADYVLDQIFQMTGVRPQSVNAIVAEKLPEFVIYTLSRFVATLPHPARPSRHQPGPHLAPSGLNAASNLGASTSQSPALPPPQPTPAPATKKKTQPKRASAAKRKKAKRGSDEEEDSDIPSEEYSPDEDDDAYEDEDSDSDYGGSSKKRKRGATRGRGRGR